MAQGPSQLWGADIIYIRTDSGFLYLAVVVDAFSRRVVSWAMKTQRLLSLLINYRITDPDVEDVLMEEREVLG